MSGLVKLRDQLSSFQIIILGFAAVILLGTIILMLPVSSENGTFTPFCDALFTATSAVCVTGLVVFDTATHWSDFGQIIILILIQIGGLGVVTVVSFLSLLSGRKIGLMQRTTMQNALSAPQVGGIVRLTRFIFFTTFAVEMMGAILLIPVFVPRYGIDGLRMCIFHSISAFCNAGFDIMGDKTGAFSSFTSFADNGYLTVIISLLIIIGGLGFITWEDIITKKGHFKEYRMQTKVILATTAILIAAPMLFFFFSDFNTKPLGERICLSVFQSVTPRTAGFNTANFDLMTDAGKGITMILMLIGGSPGSTAGGMKTTTIAILFANTMAVFKKQPHVNVFGRHIDDSIIKNATTIFFMYVTGALLTAIIISLIDGLPMQQCMFETFSAIGTVGLTLGITPFVSTVSQLILVMLMFFGRVGGLTIIYAAFSHKDMTATKYPTENIMIG